MTSAASRPDRRRAFRAGMADAAPMLIGIVPFGLVAGAAPIEEGLSVAQATGMSMLIFAGASQIAMVDVLGSGGGAAVAVATVLTINLRMVLYSASLAPLLAGQTLRSRLAGGYLLVDQVYALGVVRFDGRDDPRLRMPYYFGVVGLLWTSWQVTTVLGALGGSQVPDDVPLDFAAPLVFLVLLVPVLTARHAQVAAAVGGVAAVAVAEWGPARLSILLGGVAGIVAGTLAEARWPAADRSARPADGDGAGR